MMNGNRARIVISTASDRLAGDPTALVVKCSVGSDSEVVHCCD